MSMQRQHNNNKKLNTHGEVLLIKMNKTEKKNHEILQKNFGKFYQKLGEYLFEYLIFECEWKEMKGK